MNTIIGVALLLLPFCSTVFDYNALTGKFNIIGKRTNNGTSCSEQYKENITVCSVNSIP